MYTKAKKTGDWTPYRIHQRECHKSYRRAEWDDVHHVIQEGFQSNDSKPFWGYIKAKKQDNTGVAPLKSRGNLVSDSVSKANLLIKQFQSVFTKGKECGTLPSRPGYVPNINPLIITVDGVSKLQKKHKPA